MDLSSSHFSFIWLKPASTFMSILLCSFNCDSSWSFGSFNFTAFLVLLSISTPAFLHCSTRYFHLPCESYPPEISKFWVAFLHLSGLSTSVKSLIFIFDFFLYYFIVIYDRTFNHHSKNWIGACPSIWSGGFSVSSNDQTYLISKEVPFYHSSRVEKVHICVFHVVLWQGLSLKKSVCGTQTVSGASFERRLNELFIYHFPLSPTLLLGFSVHRNPTLA